jgi:NTP pyrophosphatase (non-canonical NTP hydrolase)
MTGKADTNKVMEICKTYGKDFYELHDLITAIRKADYEAREAGVSFHIDIKLPQLLPFVKAMDEVLCKNDHKGGWQDCDIEYLRHRLMEEIGEYFACVEGADGWDEEKKKQKQKELIDVANFCLMLWDREEQ